MIRKELWFLLVVVLMTSCKKQAGDGGLATIEGYVFENRYDPTGSYLDQVPAVNENVYIKYGDNTIYDDNADTDATGKYQFKTMQKGDYKIYSFSDCSTCPSGTDEVEVSVSVTDKKGITAAPDIEVIQNVDYNDGTASIQGVVWEDAYTNGVPPVVFDTYLLPDHNVYIIFENDAVYFDRVKTDGLGVFQFNNLLKGTYRIYSFSDCESCPSGTETQEITVEVTTSGEALTGSTITVDKR